MTTIIIGQGTNHAKKVKTEPYSVVSLLSFCSNIETRSQRIFVVQVITFIGTCLLWVGWFGFNAGSAMGANRRAAFAMLNTQISTATASLTWMCTECYFRRDPSVLGIVNGAIAGLVVMTPACGYVDFIGAFIMGLLAGPVCYAGANLKKIIGFHDALDCFGIHGIGGIFGVMLTGFFARESVCGVNGVFYGPDGHKQLGRQFYGILFSVGWSAVMSFIIATGIEMTIGLRVSINDENIGLDNALFKESIFRLDPPSPTSNLNLPFYHSSHEDGEVQVRDGIVIDESNNNEVSDHEKGFECFYTDRENNLEFVDKMQ